VVDNMHINKERKCGHNFKWTTEEDNIIKEFYTKLGVDELLKMLPNRTRKAIQERASKLNEKYLVYDENYFERIDNNEKAYWLGFLYADGYVSTGYRWGIELAKIDYNHLQKLVKALSSNIKIRERTRSNNGYCSIFFKNKKMYNDLVRNGVVPNKTNIVEFPDKSILPDKFIRDFIRGLFDGDGCYTFNKIKRVRKDRGGRIYDYISKEINFVSSSEIFIDKIREIIFQECGLKFKKSIDKRSGLYCLRIHSKVDMLRFINYIYPQDYDYIYLDRKYEKAKSILKHCLA
jgi:hypothetical protein